MIKMKGKITKDMLLGEAVSKYPRTIDVFLKHGLHCAGCGAAFSETIEQGAEMHGIDLKKLLKDLNEAAEKK
jgi:hybrid cluster-associated redox disulfide protein